MSYCKVCPFSGGDGKDFVRNSLQMDRRVLFKGRFIKNSTRMQIYAEECAGSLLYNHNQNTPHPCLMVSDELRPVLKSEKPCYGHQEWLNTQNSIESFEIYTATQCEPG